MDKVMAIVGMAMIRGRVMVTVAMVTAALKLLHLTFLWTSHLYQKGLLHARMKEWNAQAGHRMVSARKIVDG